MSVCASYVSAVRTSVTGITFCAVKVGLLIRSDGLQGQGALLNGAFVRDANALRPRLYLWRTFGISYLY